MPADTNAITLALVLTAAGATASAALITGVVQLFKSVLEPIRGRERLVAFILAAILVVVAMAAGVQDKTITLSIPSIFGAFLAWYGIAALSGAVYDDAQSLRTRSE